MTERADQRERDIVRAFVELSTELVNDYDVLEMLAQLTTNCATLLDIASAGLLLADDRGVLHLAAASSERTQQLELFQLQRDEGPCLDCYRSGAVVSVPDMSAELERWPQFSRAALGAGFKSVHAVPMKLRGKVLGALNLFGDSVGGLEGGDLDLAQALAHVACVAIVNEKSASDHMTVNSQLQHALTSRIVLEQAKGVIANAGGMEVEDAFIVLRGYARDHGRKLSEIAYEVVSRELRGEKVLSHSQSATPRPRS